jgi:hypothetical protein
MSLRKAVEKLRDDFFSDMEGADMPEFATYEACYKRLSAALEEDKNATRSLDALARTTDDALSRALSHAAQEQIDDNLIGDSPVYGIPLATEPQSIEPVSQEEIARRAVASQIQVEIDTPVGTRKEFIDRPELAVHPNKHDAGKYEPSLVYPTFIKAIAEVRRFGIEKYGDSENWRGVEMQRYLDAALRHIHAYAEGEELDEQSELPHLAHAACDLMFMLEYELNKTRISNRTYRRGLTKSIDK